MQQIIEKVKRIEPLIKTRKSELDHQAVLLNDIRKTKIEAVNELKKYQKKYMEGVETLNSERQSGKFDKLLILERSLDFIKSKWSQSLKTVRLIEEKEKQQLGHVLYAEKKLRSVKKLKEKYFEKLYYLKKQYDQKTTDASALRQYMKNR